MSILRRAWKALTFVLYDWTVSPRMLVLNERRPILYQLVTTPIITIVVALGVVAVAFAALLLGL